MIEWIITSSALILLIFVLRLIVSERVSPRLRYALWGLVLLRLLVPGTIFESRASVMTPIAAQESRQEPEDFQGFSIPFAPDSNPYLDSVPAEIVDPEAMGQSFLDPDMYFPPEEAPSPNPKNTVGWNVVLTSVWLAGAAVVTLFLVGVNLKFYLDLKQKRVWAGEYFGRFFYQAEELATPCLFGILRPSIYLTYGLDEQETAHVLAHEYTHFRQGDHVWALLRGICLALHWYNPLVWAAAVLSRRDCELSCDEGAVRLLGEDQRADYGRTLVGLVARRTTAVDLARCATTMTGGKSALKERVALLVKRPKTTTMMAAIVAAACAVFAICTFTGAAEAEEPDAPPVQSEDEPLDVDSPVSLPSLDELPAEILSAYTLGDLIDNTEPYWLLDQLYEEDIALYTANPMETAYELRGVYLRYGDHLQYFDQQICPYIYVRPHLTWYDFDGDGDNELLVVYAIQKATTMDVNELVIYEWEGGQWSEHKYDPEVLMEDFNTNAVFESDGDMSRISYQGRDVQIALGGEECFIDGNVVTYTLYGKDGWGILMNLWGQIRPTLTSTNYCFDYMCDIYYHADGTFTAENGIFSSFYDPEESLPALEDLPTELYNPYVPDWNMDPILLLAEFPEENIAFYQDLRNEQSKGLIRYGAYLQAVTENPTILGLPEVYCSDFDGDGEKELAVTCCTRRNGGWDLTVYEWDGARWTGHTANVEQEIIEDFKVNSTLTYYPDQGRAVVGYAWHGDHGYQFEWDELDVHMVARFGNRSQWSGMNAVCELREDMCSYSMNSYGGLELTIGGEIRPEGYEPDTCHMFDLICGVYYYGDGKFGAPWGYLSTDYPLPATIAEDRMTDAFRDILRSFMRETLEINGIEQADLANDLFAICDVNGDGRDELITRRYNGTTPAHQELVYDQSGNCILGGYPGIVTYYDNGYATTGWSHNQGRAGDKLWPYDLYRSNGSGMNFRYVEVARVDGWDKRLGETYESFNPDHPGIIPFPDDVDKDGDGFVYYIITEDGGYAPAYGTPMDYAEWAEWAAVYLGANAIEPTYIRLTEENIALIG